MNNYTKFLKSTIAVSVLILFSMCSKTPPAEKAEKEAIFQKEKLFAFYESDFKNKDSKILVLQISNDPDWKAYKKISNELISILISNNIDLHNYKNYNENYFYSQLGDDVATYKSKFKLGKEHASRMYQRYFSDIKICSTCNTLTLEKKEAYANTLDLIRNAKSKNNTSMKTSAESMDAPTSPDCWNLKFFACGGICAMTIELPPAFALCIAACFSEYCTTTTN